MTNNINPQEAMELKQAIEINAGRRSVSWSVGIDGLDRTITAGPYVVATVHRFAGPLANIDATARLLSSAPDMLAALKSLVEWYNDPGTTFPDLAERVNIAIATIAHAEGRAA